MARFTDPILFSQHFGIEPDRLSKLGVLNPVLNVDTRLFIDPLLLAHSTHPEMRDGARGTYKQHFDRVIRLLAKAEKPDDVAWRAARRQLSFPEVKWTCLGYGAASVSGSGSGDGMTGNYVETARQIVKLGIEDPDLFVALALFEEGVGPDRISDMTTKVILPDLLAFNARVLLELDVPREPRTLTLRTGDSFDAVLPTNPCLRDDGPIILVPEDVLRDLPIATGWSGVEAAASENAALRQRVNDHIGDIWTMRTRKEKATVRDRVLSDKEAFEVVLDLLHAVSPQAYDIDGDPKGVLAWRRLLPEITAEFAMRLIPRSLTDHGGVPEVVERIIEEFRFHIEERRLSEMLYHNGKPKHEHAAQMLFFTVAHAYCKANDLDLTPEADTGNGPVDFKVSAGFRNRAVVEIKLSTNGKLVAGYEKQLTRYMAAEETALGYYVIVDVGRIGGKYDTLIERRNVAIAKKKAPPPITLIDAIRRPSASKL